MLSSTNLADNELAWEQQKAISEAYIRKQASLFYSLPNKVKSLYLGKFVFFEDGKIKDFDDDKIAMAKRIYEKEGDC